MTVLTVQVPRVRQALDEFQFDLEPILLLIAIGCDHCDGGGWGDTRRKNRKEGKKANGVCLGDTL